MWLAQCVLVGLLVAVTTASIDLNSPLESDNIIETVNNAKTTWTAGRNFPSSMTKRQTKHLFGVKARSGGSRLPEYVPGKNVLEATRKMKLPKHFDSRVKWSNCSAMHTLRDQGPCGDCWAMAAASAFTDRLCIASNGQWNGQLSAEFLMTCCTDCGNGCDGGDPDAAWEFLQSTGLCTGGDYDSNEGCQPYTKPPCEHDMNGTRKSCDDWKHTTPTCENTCYNKNYKTAFADDFHKVSSTFVLKNRVKEAMREIYTNGPIEADFDIFEDFLSYKSGVYQYTTGDYVAGHAVKIIGWGVEKGTKYWLVANSWNSDWGDNGFFKFIRGNNNCNFKTDMTGGIAIAPSS